MSTPANSVTCVTNACASVAFGHAAGARDSDRITRIRPLVYKRLTIKGLHWKAYIHVGLVNPDPYVILGAVASIPKLQRIKGIKN
jgi:hypothetical protein